MKKNEKITRRKLLKKVGVASIFVIPTLMTFSTSKLQAISSGYSGGGSGGKGKHN